MAPILSGCLDPPPEYTVPDPVPPVLIVENIDPQTTTVYHTISATVQFTVPFRADDAGEALRALFIPDIPAGPISPKNSFIHQVTPPADPRPFADQTNRTVTLPGLGWTWQPEVGQGCHTMTMILARANNFDTTTTLGVVTIKDELATARATWLMSLGPLSNCGTWPDPGVGSSP